MKFLFSILVLLLTVKECDQKKSVDDETSKTEIVSKEDVAKETLKKEDMASEKLAKEETTKQVQQECIIEYSALSRGYFKEIKINKSTITVKNDRASKAVTKPYDENVWKNVMAKLDSIDVKTLPNLVAPTQKRLFDGAPHAVFKVTIDGKTYTTSSFDHGFPPKEIESICNKIIEISDKIKG